MQALTLALLLALSATTEEAEDRRAPAATGFQILRVGPRMPPAPDPCATARQITRQPPCLAGRDCQALQLWRQSFGSPRVEPLDPTRAAYRYLQLNRYPRHSPPDPRRPLAPGFVCPAGEPR